MGFQIGFEQRFDFHTMLTPYQDKDVSHADLFFPFLAACTSKGGKTFRLGSYHLLGKGCGFPDGRFYIMGYHEDALSLLI